MVVLLKKNVSNVLKKMKICSVMSLILLIVHMVLYVSRCFFISVKLYARPMVHFSIVSDFISCFQVFKIVDKYIDSCLFYNNFITSFKNLIEVVIFQFLYNFKTGHRYFVVSFTDMILFVEDYRIL